MSGCHHSPACVIIPSIQSKAASMLSRAGNAIETEEEASLPGDQSDSKVKPTCRNKVRKWDFNGTDKAGQGQ